MCGTLNGSGTLGSHLSCLKEECCSERTLRTGPRWLVFKCGSTREEEAALMMFSCEDTVLKEEHSKRHTPHFLLHWKWCHTVLLDDSSTSGLHDTAPHFMDSMGKVRSSFTTSDFLDDHRECVPPRIGDVQLGSREEGHVRRMPINAEQGDEVWVASRHQEKIRILEIVDPGGALQGFFLVLEQYSSSNFPLRTRAWELIFKGRPPQEGKASVWVVSRKG